MRILYLVLYSSPIKKMKVFLDKMLSVTVVGSVIFEQITIVVLAAIIVFISMKWKSSIIAVAATGMITLGGYALAIIGFDSNIFVRYSLAGGISPYLIFKDFYVAELCGNVILYPLIYAVWLCLLFLICIWRLSALAGLKTLQKTHRDKDSAKG